MSEFLAIADDILKGQAQSILCMAEGESLGNDFPFLLVLVPDWSLSCPAHPPKRAINSIHLL